MNMQYNGITEGTVYEKDDEDFVIKITKRGKRASFGISEEVYNSINIGDWFSAIDYCTGWERENEN